MVHKNADLKKRNERRFEYNGEDVEAIPYLTDEIIKQAKNEEGESRHKLLVTLQSIYQNNLKKKWANKLKKN